MKYLMLRGQVPQDRNPQEIVFDNINDVDDLWTQLFFALINDVNDYAELWYWGGDREKRFTKTFTERWVSNFNTYKSIFIPDVIFCRGGFQEYDVILQSFPKAIKIYYGAGARFLPQSNFFDYDIILQDSSEQVEVCKKKFPKAFTTLFIKPAADNIFFPHFIEKEYDVCFPANGAQVFKGHSFVYSTVPKDISVLNLGNNPHKFKYPNNVTSYRVLRTEIARHYSKCKIGIVVVNSEVDSCPRVIPELLACDLPIVVLDNVRFWKEKYVRSMFNPNNPNATGHLANKKNFWEVVKHVLKYRHYYESRKYYENNLSLKHAADFLLEKIKEVKL